MTERVSDQSSEGALERALQPGMTHEDIRVAGEALYSLDSIGRQYTRQQDEEEHVSASYGRENEATDVSDESSADKNIDSKERQTQGPGNTGGPPAHKVGLLHPSLSELRWKLAFTYLKIWFYLACLIICAFSVYWGALYNRYGNLHRLQMLVVVEDDAISNGIGDAIVELLQTDKYKSLGTWNVVKGTEEINEFFHNPTNVSAAVLKKIHHRDFWSATHVYANATYNQYLALKGESSVQTSVQFLYEGGRDITSMQPYVSTSLQKLRQSFYDESYPSIFQSLVANFTTAEKTSMVSSDAITTLPIFEFLDYRPYTDPTLLAPLQVGLIYLIIMSFFAVNFFTEPHKVLLPHVKMPQYLLYRLLGNHLSWLVIALFISTVSAIFQVDFTVSFGKAGFVIYWFTTYLTIAAVGGANENMAMLIFTYNPPFIGFWLISFVILNVSPSFSPLTLISRFYRYGYMMPIHHSNEISKVIFLGLWKGDLGWNYGVIVAWIVVNTLLMPFVLKHVGGVMAKRAKEAALAAQAAKK